jgi:hypothetical protein
MMASTSRTQCSASVSSSSGLFLMISRTFSAGTLVKRLTTAKLTSIPDPQAFIDWSNCRNSFEFFTQVSVLPTSGYLI